MKLFAKLLRSRRGISLTEVVVAMTAVVIITGAAVSVLVFSSMADVKFGAKTLALAECENAVECLRFADGNESTLESLLKKVDFVNENGDFVWKYGKSETVTVSVETDGENKHYVVKYNDEIIYETENAKE